MLFINTFSCQKFRLKKLFPFKFERIYLFYEETKNTFLKIRHNKHFVQEKAQNAQEYLCKNNGRDQVYINTFNCQNFKLKIAEKNVTL